MSDVDYDVWCDPAKPRKVTFEEISAAAFRIADGVKKTPCPLSHISETVGMKVYMKCEFQQYTGSFKERGARNALLLLPEESKKKGVIAASLGNHSQGISYHGASLKIPTTVVMPTVAPLMKVEKCRRYGANVVIHGMNMGDAKHQALVLSKEKGYAFINGYDHPDIIAGQGTVGLEILEQVPDVDAVLVPCGGGGLLAGIIVAIKHLKPHVLVYGVETDKCASMALAMKEGKPTPFEITSTLADGLAVGIVGVNAFFNIKPLIDKMVIISEDWAALGILSIVELEKFVVEGAGATCTAAIMAGLVPELEGKTVVCILSGGNIDTTVLSVCLDRGLVQAYRMVKFKVNIQATVDGLAKLCTLIASIGVGVKSIAQERAWLKGNIFSTRVVITEDWTARGILKIVELEKFVVEGAGATCMAAIMSGLVPELEGKKVVCILSGGNIDTNVLSVCLDRGLVAEQRMVKFKVNINCSPGSLAKLCATIASIGASVKDIVQERAWLQGSIFTIRVTEGNKSYKESLPLTPDVTKVSQQTPQNTISNVSPYDNKNREIFQNKVELHVSQKGDFIQSGDVDFDPWCDKDKPQKVTFEDISSAAYRIRDGVYKTPCTLSHISETVGMQVYMKCEFQQYTGSFKERGARNSLLLLPEESKKKGVVAASLGNHSQGMSYHGASLKIPITVVMPTVAPLMKVEKCRHYGANVVIHGMNMGDAKHQALILAKKHGYAFINGYDHPHVIAGQGTIGLEILEQVPDVDAVLVPCGGGGLLAGIIIAIKHLKPHVIVYGVETDKCASMAAAIKAGKPTPFAITSTLADGLAVGTVGVNAFYNIQPLVDKMVIISEDWTARGILHIVELEKFVVEGAGATAMAAIMSGRVPELEGKKVVCILSGGNVDTTVLSVCLDRGLVAEKRMVKFYVDISCSPGSLAKLCELVASLGIIVKDIVQERAWLQGSIFTIRVKMICETRGPEHVNELRALISSNYKGVFFPRENQVTNTDDPEDKVNAIKDVISNEVIRPVMALVHPVSTPVLVPVSAPISAPALAPVSALVLAPVSAFVSAPASAPAVNVAKISEEPPQNKKDLLPNDNSRKSFYMCWCLSKSKQAEENIGNKGQISSAVKPKLVVAVSPVIQKEITQNKTSIKNYFPTGGAFSSDVDFDPWCDRDKPRIVTFEDIQEAAARIQDGIILTPCPLSHISETVGMQVYMKCEFQQYTGSFKERGARNTLLLLPEESKKKGVVAASLGNHSQGMSYHGASLNIPTTVVMPTVTPLMKIEKCRHYGANVVIHGMNMGDAKHQALVLSKEEGYTFINGYDHPHIIAGQGTIGLEILEQVPDVDAVLVPCGGGGLLAGIIIAIKHKKPEVLVYGIETDKCASMAAALKAGRPTPFEITSTLADGLAVGTVGVNSFHNIQPLIDKLVVVSEDWAARAILHIIELEKFVVEGAGAAAMAAIMSGQVSELKGKRVVCVLSGGNIDTTVLSVCLDRGLVAGQRMVKFYVDISCGPGSLAKLCELIASVGVSVKDIVQERAWIQGSIFTIRVRIIAETRGPEHVNELRDLISREYQHWYFRTEISDETST